MVFPKFGLFYFPDTNLVKVDSTDIIRCEHRREENRVTSRQQLDSEDGYVEVCLPSRSRNGQAKTLVAKYSFLEDPCFRQQGMESGQMNQALENIDRHQDVMDALKEIPTLVKCVKELTTTMQRLLPSFDSDTSSGSSSPAPEMISLGNSAVVVNRKCFKRLNRSRMSLFAQDLAVLVFGRDILASSSLTGNGN